VIPCGHSLGQQFGTRDTFWTKLRDFFQQQLYLWLIQKKGFFPNIRSFRHRISSSFRSKVGPQPDDTSSHINKQFEMCDNLRLLWIWIRNPSQSLANTAQKPRVNLWVCQRIIKRQKRKKSCVYVCRLRELFCDSCFLVLNFILLIYRMYSVLINEKNLLTNWDQNEFIVLHVFPVNSGASAREARQRSTMGKKNW